MTAVVVFPDKKEYARKFWDATRVVIADDHPRVRAGIRNILRKAPDILVLGEARDGEEALQLVEELSPNVLLLDIEMPKMNGIEVAKTLKARGAPVKILVLSAYHDRQYVRRRRCRVSGERRCARQDYEGYTGRSSRGRGVDKPENCGEDRCLGRRAVKSFTLFIICLGETRRKNREIPYTPTGLLPIDEVLVGGYIERGVLC